MEESIKRELNASQAGEEKTGEKVGWSYLL